MRGMDIETESRCLTGEGLQKTNEGGKEQGEKGPERRERRERKQV